MPMYGQNAAPMIKPGCQGLKVFGGRMATQGTGNSTYEFAMELDARSPLHVGALSPILAQSRSAASPASVGSFVDVKPIAQLTDLDAAWGGTTVKFNRGVAGAAQLLAAPSAAQRTYVYSDLTEVAPVARADGGIKPLVAARCFSAAGGTALLGTTGDDFTNWATRTAGLVRLRVNGTAGDQRSATTGWSAVSTGPVVGFAYAHNGPIANIMSIGDSITEGRGTLLNESFGLLACEALNAGNPSTWLSHSSLGWSGQTTDQFVQNLKDLLQWGLVPDVLIFPLGSPNDVTATITPAIVNLWRSRTAQILALCAEYRITPVAWTMLPTNASVKAYGATDQLRVSYNTEQIGTIRASGGLVVDLATAISGPLDGNGQVTLLNTADNIHPNTTGNTVNLMPPMKAGLQTALRGLL